MDAPFRTDAPTPALIRPAMSFRSSSGSRVPSRRELSARIGASFGRMGSQRRRSAQVGEDAELSQHSQPIRGASELRHPADDDPQDGDRFALEGGDNLGQLVESAVVDGVEQLEAPGLSASSWYRRTRTSPGSSATELLLARPRPH
jgi:hypothetical protein